MQAVGQQPSRATLLQVVRMLLWAFFGVRKRVEHDKIKVTPLQVVIFGIVAGAVFVGTLVTVVFWVTR